MQVHIVVLETENEALEDFTGYYYKINPDLGYHITKLRISSNCSHINDGHGNHATRDTVLIIVCF